MNPTAARPKPVKSRPVPELDGHLPGIIEADALYEAREFYRRARWRRHSQRHAKRLGLKVIRFGARDYILGKHALEFFERLAEQQAQKSKAET